MVKGDEPKKRNIEPLSPNLLEDETDKLKLKLSNKHYERLSTQTCNIELSPFYSTFVSELERVADHLVNVGYAMVNPTGDDDMDKK